MRVCLDIASLLGALFFLLLFFFLLFFQHIGLRAESGRQARHLLRMFIVKADAREAFGPCGLLFQLLGFLHGRASSFETNLNEITLKHESWKKVPLHAAPSFGLHVDAEFSGTRPIRSFEKHRFAPQSGGLNPGEYNHANALAAVLA